MESTGGGGVDIEDWGLGGGGGVMVGWSWCGGLRVGWWGWSDCGLELMLGIEDWVVVGGWFGG